MPLDDNSPYQAPSASVGITTDDSDDVMVAYLGNSNADYYLRVFSKMRAGAGVFSWNWAAMLATSPWLLYRRLWLWFFVFWLGAPFVAGLLAGIVTAFNPVAGAATFTVAYFFIPPLLANYLFFRKAETDVRSAKALSPRLETQVSEAQRLGGTNAMGAIIFGVICYGWFALGIYTALQPTINTYAKRDRPTAAGNFVASSQVYFGVEAAEDAMLSVEDFYVEYGRYPDTSDEAGYSSGELDPLIDWIMVDEGRVVVAFSRSAHPLVATEQLFMIPRVEFGELEWRCGSASIDGSLLPESCR